MGVVLNLSVLAGLPASGWVQNFFPSPFTRAGMEKKKEESPPRVPFGHPGLDIRHPLRGLGIIVIDGKNILPVAVQNRR
jgi:hypothetical protein